MIYQPIPAEYHKIDTASRKDKQKNMQTGSIPGRVIPNTQKMVLDTALLNTRHYKVRIKVKEEQSRERSSVPLHLGVVVIEKGAFVSPSTMVTNFTYIYIYIY